jgi:hypothetical protein
MPRPYILIVDGHGFNWQQICELRKRQLEAWRASQAQQLTLFEMHEDCRPEAERTSAGRYEAPTMLDLMRGAE